MTPESAPPLPTPRRLRVPNTTTRLRRRPGVGVSTPGGEPPPPLPVTVAAIHNAAANLARHLRPTPLQRSAAFSAVKGCEVHLKIEGVQPVRAFKVRGALNKISRLGPAERGRGVFTASAGNHGLGVAYAAAAWGVPATIYVADTANPLKVEAIQRLGALVVRSGRNYDEAYHEARRAGGEQIFIHAYDDADVIAGQGTVAVEIVADLPAFDTIMVPVGGGGLLAGVSVYLKAFLPGIRVIGVEPVGAAGLHRSLTAGRLTAVDNVETIADGLATSQPGRLPFEIAQACVDEVILVEERELLSAIRLFFECEHLLAEPAGAAALAALLFHYTPAPEERVVVILSGANVTEGVMLDALRSR